MKIETIWQQYSHQLKQLLRSKINNPADVEELHQEIFLKSLQQLPQLQDSRKFQAWLFRIAHNTIIDFYRRHKPTTDLESTQLDDAELAMTAQETDLEQELVGCIQPFLRQLKPEEAELLNWIDLEGVPQKQLAEEPGISYSTLKSRVQRARQRLHQLFTRCCHFDLDHQGNLLAATPRENHCQNCN